MYGTSDQQLCIGLTDILSKGVSDIYTPLKSSDKLSKVFYLHLQLPMICTIQMPSYKMYKQCTLRLKSVQQAYWYLYNLYFIYFHIILYCSFRTGLSSDHQHFRFPYLHFCLLGMCRQRFKHIPIRCAYHSSTL